MRIDKTNASRIGSVPDRLGFGEVFSDHMFTHRHQIGVGWHDARIHEYQNISLSPAATVFHYGQEIFEGLKAYRTASGGINLFHPEENCRRCNSI